MAVVIAAGVGATMAAATGRSTSGHLFHDGANWWLFYFTGTNVLSTASSPDGATWSAGASKTLAQAHNGEGRNLSVASATIGGVKVVHVHLYYKLSNTDRRNYHIRATISGTTITYGAEAQAGATATANLAGYDNHSDGQCVATNGFVGLSQYVRIGVDGFGDDYVTRSSNADTGTAWTAGFAAETQARAATSSSVTRADMFPLASGNMLQVADDGATYGSFVQLYSSKYTTSWSAGAAVLAAAVTSADSSMWGSCRLSDTDIHVVAPSNNSNTLVHRRYNATSWANGDTPPTLTLAATSGIGLASDGASVWAFAIDSTKAVRYSKWTSGSGWAAWTTLEAARTNTPTYITATYSSAAGAIGVAWTESTGTNYNVVGSTLSLAAAPAAAYVPPAFPGIPPAILAL